MNITIPFKFKSCFCFLDGLTTYSVVGLVPVTYHRSDVTIKSEQWNRIRVLLATFISPNPMLRFAYMMESNSCNVHKKDFIPGIGIMVILYQQVAQMLGYK
jgi:hypothetical protein